VLFWNVLLLDVDGAGEKVTFVCDVLLLDASGLGDNGCVSEDGVNSDVVFWADGMEVVVFWADGMEDVVFWADGMEDVVFFSVKGAGSGNKGSVSEDGVISDVVFWADGMEVVVFWVDGTEDVVF